MISARAAPTPRERSARKITTGPTTRATYVFDFIVKSIVASILPLIEQLAQHAPDALEHPARRPRVFFGGPQDFLLTEARLHRVFASAGCPPARSGRLGPDAGLLGVGGWRLEVRGCFSHL